MISNWILDVLPVRLWPIADHALILNENLNFYRGLVLGGKKLASILIENPNFYNDFFFV